MGSKISKEDKDTYIGSRKFNVEYFLCMSQQIGFIIFVDLYTEKGIHGREQGLNDSKPEILRAVESYPVA